MHTEALGLGPPLRFYFPIRFSCSLQTALVYCPCFSVPVSPSSPFTGPGAWQELEDLWHAWERAEGRAPTGGPLPYLSVRAHMCGGRMVKVQARQYSTTHYYKQASRAIMLLILIAATTIALFLPLSR